MGRRGWVIGACAIVGAAAGVACSAADEVVRGEIVDYAEGDWRCALALSSPEQTRGEPAAVILDIDATVSAESDTAGEVTFVIDGGVMGARELTAQWQLDGTELEVDAADLLTSYAMAGVTLDTDRVEIQERAEGAQLQLVDVDRQNDTVIFGWADPWTGDDTEMTCTKA